MSYRPIHGVLIIFILVRLGHTWEVHEKIFHIDFFKSVNAAHQLSKILFLKFVLQTIEVNNGPESIATSFWQFYTILWPFK